VRPRRAGYHLEQEIEASTSSQEQRMLVAEFGLLDRQLQPGAAGISVTHPRCRCHLFYSAPPPVAPLPTLLAILGDWESPEAVDDVDESELQVLEKEIGDLKVRRGPRGG